MVVGNRNCANATKDAKVGPEALKSAIACATIIQRWHIRVLNALLFANATKFCFCNAVDLRGQELSAATNNIL